jgi:uncharacterized membrane protein (GlpM family)
MYGGLGFAGQWGGLQFSIDDANREKNSTSRNCAKMLGLFHVVIGIHHVAWAAFKNWGRLNLDRFHITRGYFLEGIVCLITGYHGLKLLMSSESDTFDQICRHKVLVDSSTFLSLIPFVMFLPANWVSYRNFTFERYTWLATMAAPLIMLFAAGFIRETKNKSDNKAKKI